MGIRSMTEEHKEKLKAGRQKKKDEVLRLKAELAALKSKKDVNLDHQDLWKQPVLNSTLPPKAKGFEDDLSSSLQEIIKQHVDQALNQVIPERDMRPQARQSVRRGAAIVKGRNGEDLSRRRNGKTDEFTIPDDLRDPNWDYQFIRVSTHGEEDRANQVAMLENGWRPVESERPGWRGRFMPAGHKGAIHNKGLMLVERPMVLTEEAKREARREINELTETQRNQFGIRLPRGFSDTTPSARAHTGVKIGRPEAVNPEFYPQHTVATGDDLEY